MPQLHLLSNGITTAPGKRNLKKILEGVDLKHKRILLISPPHYEMDAFLVRVCLHQGFSPGNAEVFAAGKGLQEKYDYVYVTEGNTFEILKFLQENDLLEIIRDLVLAKNTEFIGASAGAVLAGKDVKLALDFDKNRAGITDYEALHLFDGAVILHYTKENLKQYLRNSQKDSVDCYNCIYNIADGRMKILKV